MRARLLLLLAGSAALGGCAYGFGDYGSYGGLSVGIGSGYGSYGSYGGYGGYGSCYSPYGGYGGYGGGYGGYGYGGYGGGCGGYGYDPFWGWQGGYYYPGTGYYVYDRYRRPHVWSNTQRRYWSDRRTRALSTGKVKESAIRDNWGAFSQQRQTRAAEQRVNRERAIQRQSVRQQAREVSRSSRVERHQERARDRETRTERKPD